MIVKGEVVHGNAMGRVMGFPTANIAIQDETLHDVVSLCKVQLGDETFDGLGTYLPWKGTYEVHILDFDRDIYGQMLTIELIETIRPNHKFATQAELIDQIQKDVEGARQLLNSSSPL
jgi:riboflavin kinase / FMN adenylyltransferase